MGAQPLYLGPDGKTRISAGKVAKLLGITVATVYRREKNTGWTKDE